MKNHLPILLLAAAALLCACSGGGRSALRQAEALLETARADDAAYGFVPAEDAQTLVRAAEILEEKGSREDRLDAWYLLGRAQFADGALYRAVVSFERALAAADALKGVSFFALDWALGALCGYTDVKP